MGDFDAWAATFGQTVTEIEMAPTGGGNYRRAVPASHSFGTTSASASSHF